MFYKSLIGFLPEVFFNNIWTSEVFQNVDFGMCDLTLNGTTHLF